MDYVYDLVGKIKQATDPTGTYGFAYDNMGRLIGTTTQYTFLPGQTYSNSYTYDAASNRTGFTAPDGSTNTYVYDTLNRLSTLTNSVTGQFGFGYDALSRRTSLTRPNNVNTSYTYDNLSRLLSLLHQNGGTTIDGATYTLDNAGNRTSKVNQLNSVTENYTYDPIYQLTQVQQVVNGNSSTSENYTYDAVGNRLSALNVATYTYNNSNQLTSSSDGHSYTYDFNGNTLTKANASGTTQYTWDFENRLAGITPPNGGAVVNFKYDAFGRRIQKASSGATTNYVYDGHNAIFEMDANAAVVAKYAQNMDLDQPLGMQRAGATNFLASDGLGSITSLTDIGGSLVGTASYDAFGRQITSSGNFAQTYRYTARNYDSETGVYYYRARYYDSGSGRFLSEDPLRWEETENFYSYVRNRPLFFRDPTGRMSIAPGFSPQCLKDILNAIDILKDRIKTRPKCNCFFASHGLHAPLDTLLANPQFTLRYDPNGNGKGEENTLGYVMPGDVFSIYLTPKGCGTGPTHIAQDLAHEFAHLSLGHTAGYYAHHPVPENPDHALVRQAEAACGFAIQGATQTITVTP